MKKLRMMKKSKKRKYKKRRKQMRPKLKRKMLFRSTQLAMVMTLHLKERSLENNLSKD